MKRYIIPLLILLLLTACDIESKTIQDNSLNGNIHSWPGKIKEEEVIQTAPDLFTTNVLILFDNSGSMNGSCDGKEKFSEAVKASKEFLKMIPENANVGLIHFGGNSKLVTKFTTDKNLVINAINSLISSGSTPMDSALALAGQSFIEQAKAQKSNGKYHLVILGDGDPDDKVRTAKYLDYFIEKTPVMVHAIGFCANLDILKRPGMDYKTVENSGELAEAFKSVLAEIDFKDGKSFDNLGENW